MSRRRRTLAFSEAASGVLRRADTKGVRGGAAAVVAWREVVGPEIAKRTKGFALRENGELTIYVESAAWANQLSAMSADLIDRLNTHLGHTAVRSMRFTVSRKVTDEAVWEHTSDEVDEFYKPDETALEPLSETELDQAKHVVSPVRDPELRELALRVMVRDLERKKGARRATS